MKLNIILISVVLFGFITVTQAQDNNWLNHSRVEVWNSRTPVTVSNPHDITLEEVPIVVSIDDLNISGNDFSPGNFYVYDHQAEKKPLYQVDVPEGEDLEEIVFLISLNPGEQKTYHIYYAENGQAWPKQERYTQATDMPGWESELYAYRSYGPLAIDLFARYRDNHELMLHRFYDADNQQVYNYHEESKYGLDILHLGPTAGLAGIGLYGNGKTTLTDAPFVSEVVVSGPVRSIVRMHIESWQSEFGNVSITRNATIYAHHFETQIEDRITGIDNDTHYAVGILKAENSSTEFDKEQGLFLQWQNQGDDIGDAGIAIYIKPENFVRVVEDERNHFILAKPPIEEPLRFWAFGAWKRGENIEDLADFRQRGEQIRQLQLPVDLKLGDTQHPSSAPN